MSLPPLPPLPAAYSVALVELAAELGVNTDGLLKSAQRRGIIPRKRRGHPLDARPCWCLLPADAQRLRDLHAERRRPEEVQDWPTVQEAAQALRLTVTAFYQRRLAGTLHIRRVTLYGPRVYGHQCRYDPADVARESARLGIRPPVPPAGTVPTRTLTQICQVSRRQVHRWREAGCPHLFTMDHDAHYRLSDVLAWMEQRDMSDRKMNRAREGFADAHARLKAWQEQQSQHAA